jgi:hypothetical protein
MYNQRELFIYLDLIVKNMKVYIEGPIPNYCRSYIKVINLLMT